MLTVYMFMFLGHSEKLIELVKEFREGGKACCIYLLQILEVCEV